MHIAEEIILWHLSKRSLIRSNKFPPYIQFAKLGRYHLATAVQSLDKSKVIQANAVTGMSSSVSKARLKCLSEWKERTLVVQLQHSLPLQFRFGSDGCAAFPIIPWRPQYAAERSKQNAMAEAIERNVWLKWWRLQSSAEAIKIPHSYKISVLMELSSLADSIKAEEFSIFSPSFKMSGKNEFELIVIYLKLKGQGYVSGAAAGKIYERSTTFERAFSELYRHFMAFDRCANVNLRKNLSVYEKRLVFFGEGSGNTLVEERLNRTSSKSKIVLETPVLYQLVDGGFVFNQCQFQDHDKFISDELALCL